MMNKNILLRTVGFSSRFKTWHTLNRNMLLYIHSGTGSIISKERTYPIQSGSLCFVGSNKFYYTLPDIPEDYVRSKLFLSNQELDTVLSLFPEYLHMQQQFSANSMVYTQTTPENARRIESLLTDLEKDADKSHYHTPLRIRACIELLILLNENATDTVFPTLGMVQKAVEYINNHIHEDIRIDSICEAIHVSKYYFCKKFKQSTGITVMNYILKTRIISATNLLESTDLPIGEISEKCGFSSPSFFSQAFRKEHGVTPRQYQQALNASDHKVVSDAK